MIEVEYLQLLLRILTTGDLREGRNGKVWSVFGATLTHDLADGFPLLTTKRMFWKGIVEELAWFLRGSTDVRELQQKGVHIWDANTVERNFDAGPVYGFQWRHFGAEYFGCDIPTKSGEGVDQIAEIIRLIREEPNSRRMVLSAWNPSQQYLMCLPPCHVMYQFYVRKGRLDCQMYQRSSDVFLGLPFNIASTALLTHLMAHETGLEPGRIHIVLGDAHIYDEHTTVARKQLERDPFPLPQLAPIIREHDELWGVKLEDAEIINYKSHGSLKAKMKA